MSKQVKPLKILPIRNGNEYLQVGDIVHTGSLKDKTWTGGNDVLQSKEQAKILKIFEQVETAMNGDMVTSHYMYLQVTKSPCSGMVGQKMVTYTPDTLTNINGKRKFSDLNVVIK